MPQIITTDTELRALIPNVLATVEGESTFFDKVSPYLESAENWAYQYLGAEDVIKGMYNFGDKYKPIVSKMIGYHALMMAIPNLDLVLTPNGFGIVNNSNVAPASKDRVERLINSLETLRDNAIEQYLNEVFYYSTTWEHQQQGLYFLATFFPNLDLCNLCGITIHRWDKYQELRAKLLIIEQNLANEYFSEELMRALRNNTHSWRFHKGTDVRTNVIESIRNLEIAIITDDKPHPQTARDIVNVIRNNPTSFPEWQNSAVAKLFAPELFINKKSAGGYWF